MSDEHISPSPVPEPDIEIGKRKKDKVRAAWISFVGRIVAQFIGAAASILLGLMFVHKYQDTAHSAHAEAAPLSAPAAQQPPTLAREKRDPSDTWIAVLPLEDYSPGGRREQFASGMTEALITALSNIDGLRVVSRTSSARYKGMSKPLPEIGRELDVNWIVEGSVLLEANHLRVTGQLIDTATDEHRWATAYDRPYTHDVLSIQASLASRMAKDVETAIGRDRHRRLAETTGANASHANTNASTPRSSRRPAGIAGSPPSADWEGTRSPAIRSRFPES
jgi:TolB-like protein